MDRGTYNEYDLDAQPPITGLTGDLRWLEGAAEPKLWSIGQDDDGEYSRLCSIADLERVGVALDRVDPVFVRFLESSDLQRRIRSSTGCYLDLADTAVGIRGSDDELVHFLSDQQWVMHWLVVCGESRHRGMVVATSRPYGFENSVAESSGGGRVADLSADGGFTVVADSFEEFLQRLWIENEIYFAALDGAPDSEPDLIVAYRNELAAD